MTAAAPILRWTPHEPWLWAELARRTLVASLDGGMPAAATSDRFGADVDAVGDRFGVDVVAVGGGELQLAITCDAALAVLALAPLCPGNHRWRAAWQLVIERPGESVVLQPGASVPIRDARRSPLVGKLRREPTAIADALGGEPVPLHDAAFHRYTRQSTAVDERTILGVVPWALPTQPERAPWWEIDLGHAMTIATARIDLVAPPPGTRVRVYAFGYLTPHGVPPTGSLVVDTWAEALVRDGDHAWLELAGRVVARFVRVELVARDGVVVLAVTAAELQAAELYPEGPGSPAAVDTLRESLRRAFVLHGTRPLELVREGRRYVEGRRYGDVARVARALANGLALRLEAATPGRVAVGVMLRNSVEWIVADLAILERGYLSIALSPDDGDDRFATILDRAQPACIICDARDSARVLAHAAVGLALVVACGDGPLPDDARCVRWETILDEGRHASSPPPVAARADDDIYAVLFTSGSTGTPKGAMRTYRTFLAMIASYAIGHAPRHLSFQPLSHLSERMYLPAVLVHGGAIGFSAGGAHLLDELRALEPTTLGSVPRLYEVLHAKYQRRLREGVDELTALAEARAAFGTRLLAVSVGSAPVSREIFAFMRRVFADLWVTEGYGSTEVGSITYDGKVADHVAVKLVPVPGTPPRSDRASERGEIYVKTPHAIAGYLGDPAATAAAIDRDGYVATGDLGERGADGRVYVIGRLRNTVKLAHGEFVSAERIEAVLATTPGVDRIFVHVENGASGVAALVMPTADLAGTPADHAAMATALAEHGRMRGLAAYEIPRAILLAPITVDNGLVTANGKLARGAIAMRHGAALGALVDGSASKASPSSGTILDRVLAAAGEVLRRPVAATDPLGVVDSLGAAEVLAALADVLGREVPLPWWFEARTWAELAERLVTHTSDARSIADLAIADLALVARAEPRAAQLPASAPILVTGATGFLGAHLVEALRARGVRVVCLVRASDSRAALDKLGAALAARGIAPDLVGLGREVQAIAGDLAAPDLAIAPSSRPVLDDIGAVIHAGATVSWLAPYSMLRGPNVLGTLALLDVAAGRPFHHVSTISTTFVGGDEQSTLPLEHAVASGPYALSKWIAEQHVRRAGQGAGVPVAIYRPAMIAGHTARGTGNPDDFLSRYLAGCAELGLYIDRDDAILDMTPVDFVARAIVALALERAPDGSIYHLANVEQSLTFAGVGLALVAAGVAVEPASYDAFRAALHARRSSRLAALAAFFPETFSLGMGPWPCERTLAALAPLGVPRPRIDEAVIARYVAAGLRR